MSGRFIFEAAVRDLVGEPSSVGKGGSEFRFGAKGSLLVNVAHGIWFNFEAGIGGGMLDLATRQLGGNRSFAIAWLKRHAVEGFAGEPIAPTPKRDERSGPASRDEAARRLWVTSRPPAGTHVERYLGLRCLSLPINAGAAIRFHHSCPFGPNGRRPAMVALIRNVLTGKPQGVHRTALTPAGERATDAAGEKLAKMMLGRAGDGAVMLSDFASVETALGLAEGIETALAVSARTPGLPIWAALSAGGIARFPLLPAVDHLTIFADADPAGIAAARACAARWAKAGRWWAIESPTAEGADFADLAGPAAA